MNRFCPNCGDPAEDDEIFCDKCGTKLSLPQGGENAFQSNAQTPNPQYNYQQNSYNPGQQNTPAQFTPNPQFQQGYVQPKKSAGKKALIIIFSVIGTILSLLVILGIIGSIALKKQAVNNPAPAPSTDSNKSSAVWLADINAHANFDATEKKIYVEYSVSLANKGSGSTTNVNVYLDPEQNDPNVNYLGIGPKTIVNDSEPIASVNGGEAREVNTKYYYENIDASAVTQEKLQDIVNRYISLPLLIEWQENGKTFTQKITTNYSSDTSNSNNTTDTTNNENSNSELSFYFDTFQLAVPGVSYTQENSSSNTSTTYTSTGVQSGAIKINSDGTYIWNSTWDGKIINGNWQESGDSAYPIRILQGEEGKDWLLGKSDQSGSDIYLLNGSIWKVGVRVK
jgi:flagellar basal body-associated protein FliL